MTVQTVALLHLQYTDLKGVPVCYDKERHPTSIKTLPPLAFRPQDKEDELHSRAN